VLNVEDLSEEAQPVDAKPSLKLKDLLLVFHADIRMLTQEANRIL